MRCSGCAHPRRCLSYRTLPYLTLPKHASNPPAESRCTVDEEYPSPFHFQLQQQATSAYSTLFIARDPLNPGNGFCDPKAAGEPCLYYVTVFHPGANSGDDSSSSGGKGGGVGFTLTASTPSDVTVLPTRTRPAAPDGVVTSSLATVDESGSKKYQMYAQPRGGAVLLTLEACTGELSLAVCDGSCRGVYPTEADYGYFADATRACTRGGCRPAADLVPRIGLDRAEGNAYFVAVNGSGTFRWVCCCVVSCFCCGWCWAWIGGGATRRWWTIVF